MHKEESERSGWNTRKGGVCRIQTTAVMNDLANTNLSDESELHRQMDHSSFSFSGRASSRKHPTDCDGDPSDRPTNLPSLTLSCAQSGSYDRPPSARDPDPRFGDRRMHFLCDANLLPACYHTASPRPFWESRRPTDRPVWTLGQYRTNDEVIEVLQNLGDGRGLL